MTKELAPEKSATSGEEDLRYERKFLILRASVREVETVVKRNPAFFREIYHERAINNIYLDTPSRRYYFENVDGFSTRRKARIRWYGDLAGFVPKPILEFKIKDGLLGCKKASPLRPFTLDERFSYEHLRELLRTGPLAAETRALLQFLEPALINRYRRKYYLSADGLYRVTIDFDLQFYNVHPWGAGFLSRYLLSDRMVLELKYGRSHHHHASEIASALPFRLSRMSKYVLGMDCLNGI
jgi:hypothetical protein